MVARAFYPYGTRSLARLLLPVVAGLCLLAPPAHGQYGRGMEDNTHALSLGFGGGVSVPVGDAKDAFKNGVNGQGFLLIHLGPLPSIRLNLGYQRFDFKNLVSSLDGSAVTGHSDIYSGTGGISVDLISGPIRPYVTAGLGAFDVRSALDQSAGGASSSKVNFGIDGGAGLAVEIGRIKAFGEGRVQNVYTRNGGLTSYSSIRTVPVTFGLLVGL